MNPKHIEVLSRCINDLTAVIVEIKRGHVIAGATVRDLAEAMVDSQIGVPATVLLNTEEAV